MPAALTAALAKGEGKWVMNEQWAGSQPQEKDPD
jgi:hypothetical protein